MQAENTNFRTIGKLSRSDIRYLAFEGGGGKGFAYIGAIQALEELGLLRTSRGKGQSPSWTSGYLKEIDPTRRLISDPIRGISGSSAGAITALLVSSGYNADDIQHIMTQFDFNRLFEPPTPRYVPKIQVDPSFSDPRGVVEKSAIVPDSVLDMSTVLKEAVSNISTSRQEFLNEQLGKLISFSDPILATLGMTPAHSQEGKTDTAELLSFLESAISRLASQQ